MKHKTSELTGALLDEAVFKAEGLGYTRSTIIKMADFGSGRGGSMVSNNIPAYSTDWNAGGPIIERERIDITSHGDGWSAGYGQAEYGQTPLIAAMRAYVASKLGQEVEL